MNEQSKLGAFRTSMTEQADADCKRLEQEMEEMRTAWAERDRARAEAGEDACIAAARAQAKKTVRQSAARVRTDYRRKLLLLRESLTELVFADARAELAAFAAAPAYTAYRRDCVRRLIAAVPQEGTVLLLRPCEMEAADTLRDLWTGAIAPCADIVLGGVRAQNKTHGILADETLDSALEAQRAWFRMHSHVAIPEMEGDEN